MRMVSSAQASPRLGGSGTVRFRAGRAGNRHLGAALLGVALLGAALAAGDLEAAPVGSGTGFLVDGEGAILTNFHVVDGCDAVAVAGGPFAGWTRLIGVEPNADLAALRAESRPEPGAHVASAGAPAPPAPVAPSATGMQSLGDMLAEDGSDRFAEPAAEAANPAAAGPGKAVAVFAAKPPEAGQEVIALGFPQGFYFGGDQHKVSTGVVSSTAGLYNDLRNFLHTAPIHGGNSGGPLFDQAGHVLGVNVAYLGDDDEIKRSSPVFIAIRGETAKTFLDTYGIGYREAARTGNRPTEEIVAEAKAYTVQLICHKG